MKVERLVLAAIVAGLLAVGMGSTQVFAFWISCGAITWPFC